MCLVHITCSHYPVSLLIAIRRLVPACDRVLTRVRQTHTETNSQGDGQDDEHDNEQTPPLESLGASRRRDALLDLGVSLLDILYRALGVLLGRVDGHFLLLDEHRHVVEQGSELYERLLDPYELVVPCPDVAEYRRRLARAVRAELRRC